MDLSNEDNELLAGEPLNGVQADMAREVSSRMTHRLREDAIRFPRTYLSRLIGDIVRHLIQLLHSPAWQIMFVKEEGALEVTWRCKDVVNQLSQT
jgi:hypothetical protein